MIELLRDEWGFEGIVMTDWFAVANTESSLGAGLDLEMPGPGRALGATVLQAVENGQVDKADVDAAVGRLLRGLDRIGALDAPEPAVEPVPPSQEDVALIRRAAGDSTVLLRNDGTLPLDRTALARVAVLGPNAASPCIMGGGSAQVVPHWIVSPLDALAVAFGDAVDIVHERGCEAGKSRAVVGTSVLRAPDGFEAERFAGLEWAGDVVERRHHDDLRMMVFGAMAGDDSLLSGDWSERVRGTVVAWEDGVFELALAQAGRARVFLDGDLVLDGFTDPPPRGGTDFFGQASKDLVTDVELERGKSVELVVEYACVGTGLAGYRVGFRTKDADGLLDRAVAAAAAADVAVVFVGTSEEWETEGRDRTFFALPGRQDELVRNVAAANQRTVVVVNAGAPVDLSWADDVAAVLQCWFGGQEMGAAVGDVLVGDAEPGGRLPTSIPMRLEHNPSYDNFPGENGELRYGEGVFMGYRGYERRAIEPRFAFGHGLGYTTFRLGPPSLSSDTFRPGQSLTVSVTVTNTGDRAGSEVVQCYVAPRSPRLARPPKELKAFAKVRLEPGESTTVELSLDDRSFAYWDPGQAGWDEISSRASGLFARGSRQERRAPGWQVDPGRYDILVGRSSVEIVGSATVEVEVWA